MTAHPTIIRTQTGDREKRRNNQEEREKKKSDYTSFIDASHHSCGVCPQYAVNPDSKL